MVEHLIRGDIRGIAISGIRQMANRVAQYKDVFSLTIGQPDFPTPPHIVEAAARAARDGKTVYTPNAGLPELRDAAAAFVRSKYGLEYRGSDETLVTVGASQAIDMALRTILEPGVEVVLPGPVYPGYEPLIRLCGAIPVYVDVTDSGFKLTAEKLEPALTERTRCVILASPSNPTGAALAPDELSALAELLSRRDLFVISDEIYSELVYDRPHASIASYPGMRERTIVVNGLSKSHSMTGWRIGFTFAPAAITQHMVKVLQYNVTCAASVSQYAALEALTAGIDDALPMREAYVARRDYAYARLVAASFDVAKPEGAFYIFPSVRKFGLDSTSFAYRLLDEQRVAVVPGSAFTPLGEGYVRLSYACSMETLAAALDRIERFADGLSSS
ncbi:aminotransferase A [Paenibacillus antri]|uniref:Aminotransferase n=1 Tax=Paenibacillus antri TaxID=2582848 RepID=A0A5R9GBC1_9BACL|nr:aminotransferase A [Paenibacillus antri]TLS50424.1 aminotransferase A [Paenibacillus antri]